MVRQPYFNVTLEGIDISDWISSVKVTEDDHAADSVSIKVADPHMLLGDAFFEGSCAEIDLGYVSEHALVLRAIITKVEMRFRRADVPELTLKGEDRSIEMAIQPERNRRWENTTVSEVVRIIGQENGFNTVEVQIENEPPPSSEDAIIHQDGKTDLDFLQELAREYNAMCFVELDERGQEILYFIPERRVLTARRADQLTLTYRGGIQQSNLIHFSPGYDSNYVARRRELYDIDTEGQEVESDTELPELPPVWQLNPARVAQAPPADSARVQALYAAGVQRRVALREELTAMRQTSGEVVRDQNELRATNAASQTRTLGMKADGSTFGNIWLRAKSYVTVEGVSERFRGEWYVRQVTHKIDTKGFVTDFRCER